MDIEEETSARENHRRVLCKRLLDGANLVDEIGDDPTLLIGYKRLKMDIE